MTNTEHYLKLLERSNEMRASLIQTILASLSLPSGSRGLDAGCGNGFYTLLLAAAAGEHCHVTGLDSEASFLARGRALADDSVLCDRVSFETGDIGSLPFPDRSFDWAFCMDLIGKADADPVALLRELTRTVKPNGRVFILNWTSQMLLPGYPGLEARLNTTPLGLAPYTPQTSPEQHLMRAPDWFRAAGLHEIKPRTFVGDLCAPFSRRMRDAVTDLFEMRWGTDGSVLSQEDRVLYRRLCAPDSPDSIADLPGYYGFYTYSLCEGLV